MDNFPALYTETLSELLQNKGYGTESQDSALTEILSLMDKFPTFEFGDDISLDMKDLFIDKYDIREIGSETEELFLHFWKETCNELIIKYVPKIDMWIKHFNELFIFTVQLTASHTESNSNDNLYYLNPVSSTGTNLKVQDKSTNNESITYTHTRDVLQSVWGKTRAKLLEQIFELRDVYNECLKEFESLFMGVI